LRERPEDIDPLVKSMIETFNEKYGTHVTSLSAATRQLFSTLRWEGNVRELRNIMERAVIIAGSGEIKDEHLPLNYRSGQAGATATLTNNGHCEAGVAVGMTLDDAERWLIEATLKHAANNKTRAAGILGISTKTLHIKLKQYRLSDGSESD
jgi:DNA-binding NtrC family response regulator